MNKKNRQEIRFSMNEINDNTVLIEGYVTGKLSKKDKIKIERGFAKISLHVFDKAYIEELQEIVMGDFVNEKSKKVKLIDSLSKIAKFLMK